MDEYREGAPRTFVISESMARKHLAHEDPIGKRLIVSMGDDKPGEIVGVVGDIKYNGLDGEVRPMVYYMHPHLSFGFMALVVRTTGGANRSTPALLRVLREMDPEQPVSDIRTVDDLIASSISQPRFQTAVLAIFAVIALILAAVGIYGVMSDTVAQKTNEIGIRMALGARESDVLRMVLGQGMAVAGIGLTAGVAASLGLTRLLKNLLFEVEPSDPWTFAAIVCAMAVVALLACYVPARRAMALEPTAALCYE